MSELTQVIPVVRESTVAILRIHVARPETVEKGVTQPTQVSCTFGSGFCVAEDRLVVTAHHVLNPQGAREANDRFYAFTVPGNGQPAYAFPVGGYPVERPDLDLAVLEIGPCATPGIHLPALPISFGPFPDGSPVVTVGYPAPEIASINIDPGLNYIGGQFFLKSHANEGIVAAQYEVGGNRMYELNVGWHHGESGGPVACVGSSPAVFSLMQHYRNVESPHGTVAGPHRGFALTVIAGELAGLGIAGV